MAECSHMMQRTAEPGSSAACSHSTASLWIYMCSLSLKSDVYIVDMGITRFGQHVSLKSTGLKYKIENDHRSNNSTLISGCI